jgi:hypothetical protein
MQQNDIYNIPLPRGPGPKKKHKKRTNMGQITRSELKRRIPHGDPKYLLGTVVTPAIFPLSGLPAPQDYQPHTLVPSLAASTFTFGALSWRYRELKF